MLDAAAALASGRAAGSRFGCTSAGRATRCCQQSIYRLEHAGLGALEIFIVPIGRDAESTTYEAIFT